MWFQKKEGMNMNQNWNFKRDRRFKPKKCLWRWCEYFLEQHSGKNNPREFKLMKKKICRISKAMNPMLHISLLQM